MPAYSSGSTIGYDIILHEGLDYRDNLQAELGANVSVIQSPVSELASEFTSDGALSQYFSVPVASFQTELPVSPLQSQLVGQADLLSFYETELAGALQSYTVAEAGVTQAELALELALAAEAGVEDLLDTALSESAALSLVVAEDSLQSAESEAEISAGVLVGAVHGTSNFLRVVGIEMSNVLSGAVLYTGSIMDGLAVGIYTHFRDGGSYLYENSRIGLGQVEEMIQLGERGSGLTSFIYHNVQQSYS